MKLKTILTAAAVMGLAFHPKAAAQEDIVKTGLNFGPLPAIAYDADKGFQYGGILQIYDYGNGTNYPNYDTRWYLEASWFTKGSKLFNLMFDNLTLIPGVRIAASLTYTMDSAYDFYGFNGYNTYYDEPGSMRYETLPSYQTHPFYRIHRDMLTARVDFLGQIVPHLRWEAGYHFSNFDQGTIDYASINKGKEEAQMYPSDMPTLLDYYCDWGIIPESDKNGGRYGCLRLGLEYDTRDKEGAPTRGIWAEGHVNLAPTWLGSTVSSYRYAFTFRHYLPIIGNDILTFAYRLNYEGNFGSGKVPYYILPFVSVIGMERDIEGMGGSNSGRGLLRSRVVGLDTGIYTAELRWRFVQFQLFNQNIAFALNAFSDGAMVFRPYDLSYNPKVENAASKALYDKYITTDRTDRPHVSFGGGIRFIMNENFIVAADYGMPVNRQDGPGALYINLGYLF